MNKDAYTLLFEVDQQQPLDMYQLALIDGVEPELESGVWQTWARHQRGYVIARHIYVGQTVYALYWHKTGYWGFVNYRVTHVELCDECTIENMAHRREYVLVTNKYGKVRRIPIHAIGYSVLTTIQYAQRAAAIKNAADAEKVMLGVSYARLTEY